MDLSASFEQQLPKYPQVELGIYGVVLVLYIQLHFALRSFFLILLDPECFPLNLVPSLDTEILTVLLLISLLWATRPTFVSKPCHCLELGSHKLLISHFPTLSNTLGFCFLTHTQPRWNWMFLRSLEFVCSALYFSPGNTYISLQSEFHTSALVSSFQLSVPPKDLLSIPCILVFAVMPWYRTHPAENI